MASPSHPLYGRDYVLLNVVNFLYSLYSVIFIFLPAYMYRLGIREGEIGVLMATGALVSVVLKPGLGMVVGRGARRTFLSLGAFQVQLLFLDRIATGFPAGAVTINAYARNFQSVLVGVVGIAVAQSVYSILSQAAAVGNAQRFRSYFRKGIALSLFLTISVAVALVLLAPVAAWLVSLQGALQTFSVCLLIYAVSIPFESVNHLQLRAFYAFKDTLVPALFGVLGGVSAMAVAAFLAPRTGIYAVAAGYSVGVIVQTVGLGLLLPRKQRTLVALPEDPDVA